jgi:hypothetical protein
MLLFCSITPLVRQVSAAMSYWAMIDTKAISESKWLNMLAYRYHDEPPDRKPI